MLGLVKRDRKYLCRDEEDFHAMGLDFHFCLDQFMIKWLHEWKVFSKWDMGNTLSLDVTQSTLIEFNYTKRRGTVMQSYTLPSSFSFLSNFRKDVSVLPNPF